jgi:hypothetical protein
VAQARAALGLFDEALQALAETARLAPADAAVRSELERVKGLKAAVLNKEKRLFAGMFGKKPVVDSATPQESGGAAAEK